MEIISRVSSRSPLAAGLVVLLAGLASGSGLAAERLSPQDVLRIQTAGAAAISPDGEWVAYTLNVPRKADDEAGAAYGELHVASTASASTRPFVTGEVSVRSPRWSPDGSQIAFLMKRGEEAKTQVWSIRVMGGEAFEVTRSKSDVLEFRWHPDGRQIAYVASTPPTKRDEKLKEKGYGFVFFEENLHHRNLYLVRMRTSVSPAPANPDAESEARQLTEGFTVWTFELSPKGKAIALSASDKNLIDHRYAFRKIHLLDVESGKLTLLRDVPGKLGNFAFSPDGSKLAYAAARDRRDHAVSQAYVMAVAGGDPLNLTPPGFRGHVDWVGWKDPGTVVYHAGEGVWNTLSLVPAAGGEREVILHSEKAGVVVGTPTFTGDFRHAAMLGTASDIPEDVYHWSPGEKPKRLTTLNPWLAERELGRREVVRYPARDGREIEGILYYPVGHEPGRHDPLVVIVHGGPEGHYENGWHTRYSEPAQVLAGRGYFVFLPNYRSSTGYGVDATEEHLGDAAGKEFDDIADGIDHLVGQGLVDRDRVGLGGGSYGGFAAAWFSSYYTQYVKAVCMFVGISDNVSKRGTSDIPYEELFVHSGAKLEAMWQQSLERSPIYHAHKSLTAVLIMGGQADTRVHPSQSLEYFRRLKMNDHPAVRLVQYPGERHGNRKQPGRIDVLFRTLQWYDWYVKDQKPLAGPMPPLDIADSYGLELEDEK